MGYDTLLYLDNVKIKNKFVSLVTQALKTGKGRGLSKIRHYFKYIILDSEGFLHIEDHFGGWNGSENLASWLKQHCEKDGRIVEHSLESDGVAWGWEFDGKGKMKYFQLEPVGKWR